MGEDFLAEHRVIHPSVVSTNQDHQSLIPKRLQAGHQRGRVRGQRVINKHHSGVVIDHLHAVWEGLEGAKRLPGGALVEGDNLGGRRQGQCHIPRVVRAGDRQIRHRHEHLPRTGDRHSLVVVHHAPLTSRVHHLGRQVGKTGVQLLHQPLLHAIDHDGAWSVADEV